MSRVGIVAIGRNEGERLRRCLGAVAGRGLPVVYVDGNSTDGSVELARSLGVEVVVEDPSRRNSAATARNAGLRRLLEIAPDVPFVQFVDGDCEIVEGWLDRARRVLEGRPDVGLVTGRRRERFPDRSPYNRLADIEWDAPPGETLSTTGDVMIRSDALLRVGAFDEAVWVGEDTDLCIRLRKAGWILLRIDAEMTLHDMAMTRFGQWWRRTIRTGYAFAQGALMHGRSPGGDFVHHVRSTSIWGIALPLSILGLGLAWPLGLGPAWSTLGSSLLLALAYPAQALRIALRDRKAGMPFRDAWLYGWSCTLGRLAHAVGLVRFGVERFLMREKRERVITYK